MSMYSSDELLDAGIIYRNKREQLDVTIGDGMELLIRGDKNKKKKPPTSSSYNSFGMHQSSTDENCYLKDKYEYDTRSTKSYGSHEHDPYDSESHRGSKRSLHNAEEKKDPSKEDVEIDPHGLEGNDGITTDVLNDEEYKEQGQVEMVEDVFEEEEYPEDCFPPNCYKKFPFLAGDDETPFWLGWGQLRLKTFQLIENKYFETAVITMILLSSLALALEDVHLQHRPVLQDILYYMDRIFTVIFFLEMLIKWLALGFRNYFTNAWCWLDFIIVMLSLVNLAAIWFGFADIPAFRSMRTLRALRPLRAVSRWEGMRVVVNALVQAIPSIFNVLLVCLIFWLIFAIMGVQLFAGKYYKCVDPKTDKMVNHEIIPDKNACIAENYTWQNSKMNFDHVGNAYLCLFQVATFNGWMEIMRDAVDSRDLHGKQPIREINNYMYFYFVFFIIFGSFFTLNLFIGVIIDNFNEQKKKTGASLEMFMTEDQKKYYNAMKKMSSKKPLKAIPRPRWKPQSIVFQIVTDKKFDMLIMLFIGFNMLTMTLDHYQQTKLFTDVLELLNQIFIAIFSSECLLKIFALRYYYFKEPWNLFDFIVVILSLAGLVLSDLISKYFVSPTLLRVVRVAKVGRVLRLVKGAKGIRTLLFALAMSLPALFNICLLLFLVMFIFAIFGMSFFMNVDSHGGLDQDYNFRTFGQSMILLFMLSTSSGWDAVLDGITNEENCEKPNLEMGITGSCGSTTVGTAFLLSYLVINFLIVINMYIAVILENYSQATEDVQEGLTDDDYDMYYEIWQHFDPDGTRYIRYDQLSDFLDILEPPLKIHKPNKYKIVSMDIPICKGDLIYCVDILDALTKDFFARKGNPIIETVAEIGEIQTRPEEAGYEPISSTLWRMREVYCAIIIQSAWRKFARAAKEQTADEDRSDGAASPDGRETAVLVESDGFVTKNGHKVVIHSRSSSKSSRLADV
ncbi:sodium channel protein para-like isoform X2 [Sipha flava]|uniref:Sodium channel protein n=4 Tax=Sipha flava TaxID=143950 RepID=A0A8B8FA44_9HEMI|nr:sodium channel protein para-like isoform X2 [Sipha flava]